MGVWVRLTLTLQYLFPEPDLHQRTLYCQYWKHKLQDKPSIEFPEQLCPAIARITEGFSFAYLKEAFVAALIVIAGRRSDNGNKNLGTEENLDKYELWREIKRQIQLLKDDMDQSKTLAEKSMILGEHHGTVDWEEKPDMNRNRFPLLDTFDMDKCPPAPMDSSLPMRFRDPGQVNGMHPAFLNNFTIQSPQGLL